MGDAKGRKVGRSKLEKEDKTYEWRVVDFPKEVESLVGGHFGSNDLRV